MEKLTSTGKICDLEEMNVEKMVAQKKCLHKKKEGSKEGSDLLI